MRFKCIYKNYFGLSCFQAVRLIRLVGIQALAHIVDKLQADIIVLQNSLRIGRQAIQRV